MTYRIVLDSSGNLESLPGVDFASVPLKIVTDEREFVDDRFLDIEDMLTYLEAWKGRSGTACPSIGDWLEAFGDAERIFAVTITGSLSGCCNAAIQAGRAYEQEHPGRKVCVLDSLSTGPEMVLIAEKLAWLLEQKESFEETETHIRAYMNHTHLLFSLESLNNLARNGRVSPLVAKAAGLLGIRVVGRASEGGTLQPMHKARGNAKAMSTLAQEMEKLGWRGGRVRIAHCRNPEGAALLAEKIRAEHPDCDLRIGECGGLCGFYAERGGVLVGFED